MSPAIFDGRRRRGSAAERLLSPVAPPRGVAPLRGVAALLGAAVLASGCTTGLALPATGRGSDSLLSIAEERPGTVPERPGAEPALSEIMPLGKLPPGGAFPHGVGLLPLEAATKTVRHQETRGLGIIAGFSAAPINTLAAAAVTPGGIEYAELFDNGAGFTGSLILRRPSAGTVAAGDSFALGTFSFYTLPGKEADGEEFDSMTIWSVWLDGKTIIEPVGATGAWKSYVIYGIGLAHMSDVAIGSTNVYNAGFVPGLHGKFGLEYRLGAVGLFVDFGVEVLGAPTVDSGLPYQEGEPLYITPVTIGAIINY